MADLNHIAKEASERAAHNAGISPELLYAPILWVLQDNLQFEPKPADRWTITCRHKLSERISFAWALLFRWPKDRAHSLSRTPQESVTENDNG